MARTPQVGRVTDGYSGTGTRLCLECGAEMTITGHSKTKLVCSSACRTSRYRRARGDERARAALALQSATALARIREADPSQRMLREGRVAAAREELGRPREPHGSMPALALALRQQARDAHINASTYELGLTQPLAQLQDVVCDLDLLLVGVKGGSQRGDIAEVREGLTTAILAADEVAASLRVLFAGITAVDAVVNRDRKAQAHPAERATGATQAILDYLEAMAGEVVTVDNVVAGVEGIALRPTVLALLSQLALSGQVFRVGRGLYTWPSIVSAAAAG